MKSLTILVDADDTCENLTDCWVKLLNEKYHLQVSVKDVTDWDLRFAFPMLTQDQIYNVLYEDELWKMIEPIKDSQMYLQKWRNQGHTIYMVTAHNYQTCKIKAERLIELFQIDWDHIIVTRNKQMIKGDILIDDGFHNLIFGDYYKIMFTRNHNRKLTNLDKFDIHRADTWSEIDAMVQWYANQISHF